LAAPITALFAVVGVCLAQAEKSPRPIQKTN